MAQKLIDMTGQRIGRLTVIGYAGPRSLWNVKCDCGTEKIIRGSDLRRTKSCGCLDSEVTAAQMNLRAHIGKYLYWLGFRMQPPNVRRGISLLTAIGLEWSHGEHETKLLERHMRGEKLELGVSFKTTDLTSAQHKD